MKTTIKILSAFVLQLLILQPAHALPIELNFSPNIIYKQDYFTVDITLSNLHTSGAGSLGAFGLDVVYNSTNSVFGNDIIALRDLSFSDVLGTANLDTIVGGSFEPSSSTADRLSIFNISLLPAADLLALPDSFILASLVFSQLDPGYDILSFDNVDLSDAYGNSLHPVVTGSAIYVPEPGSLLLLAISSIALIRLRMSMPTDHSMA